MAQPPTGTRLPATGNTITMSEIQTFFGDTGNPIVMSTLGVFLGISVGATITMSATFGDLLVDDYLI
jgi:hypothetical protein